MSVTAPPRRPDLDDRPGLDTEALIEEARRRARRRRQRNVVGAFVVLLGGLWLYSLIAGARTAPTVGSLARSANAAPPLNVLPDELSFNADGAVWLVRRDGSTERLVDHVYESLPDGGLRAVHTMYGVEWSPDGSKLLAFRQSTAPALVLVDANGEIGPTIASGASVGRWSPDGTRVAFVRGERGAGNALFVASRDGRRVRRVATHAQYGRGTFSWSPDGTRIVYAGRGDTGLFVADARGRSTPSRIHIAARRGVGETQWSPDGSLIAFTSGGHLYVVRPDGTASRRVAAGYRYGIAWSPNSRLIALQGPAGPRTYGDVSVVRRDGSRLRRVARCTCSLRGPGFSPSLSWSTDGSRLAYVGGRGNVVSTVRPDGVGATRVVTRASRGFTGNWYPSWPLWRSSKAR